MPSETEIIVLKTAARFAEAEAIIHRQYEKEGVIFRTEDGGITTYLASPDMIRFGAAIQGILYGTVSIIADSEHGLPMDDIYRDELAPLRAAGKKISEVGRFAVDHALFEVHAGKDSPFIALPLIATVLSFAERTGIDYLCISHNPKHHLFYQQLGFTNIGDQKEYALLGVGAIGQVLYMPEWQTRVVSPSFKQKLIDSMPNPSVFV